MNNVVLLDTNCFYDVCRITGLSIKCFEGQTNTNVDYKKLTKEIQERLLLKELFITPTLLTEVVSHFRNDEEELRRIINHLIFLEQKYEYCLMTNNYGQYFGSLRNLISSGGSLDYRQALINIEKIVENKIDNEAEVLTFVISEIAMSYLACSHKDGDNITKAGTFSSFIDLYQNGNRELINKYIKDKIKTTFIKAYSEGKEKNSFRTIFDEVLRDCSAFLFIVFDYINDYLDGSDEPHYDAYEIIDKAKGKPILNRFSGWCSKNKAIESIKQYCEMMATDMLGKNYSKAQCEYLTNVVISIYSSRTKMDKNDSEDFWHLGYIRKGAYLLTFDLQMVDAIDKSEPENANYLRQFFK